MRRRYAVAAVALAVIMLCVAETGRAQPAAGSVQPRMIEYLEFREVDIKDVLRQLARQYDLNIVFSESVKGLVTVQLSKVSIEQALDSIITVNGFAYTRKDGVYKITTQDEAVKEGKQTKLFKLNNAEALKLKDTLSKMLGADGSIEADTRANALVITDTISTLNRIEAMIPQLDEITAQVLIEAKIIETSLTNTEKLGIDWTATVTASGSKRPTTFPFKKWGADKDYYPVPEYTSSLNNDTGQIEVTSAFPFKGEQYLTAGQGAGFGSFPMAAASQFAFGTLDFSSFQAVLDVIKSRSNTKLVASPRVVTLNNQQATINVGRTVPIALYERNDTTGRWEITGWQEQNVGVNLKVTPQISPDGHIKLKLKPEVSNIVDYIGEGENQRPITSVRTAETEVIIKDGMTVVIAGLVKEKDAQTVKKIPLLGDLPLLGKLFTRTEVGSASEPKEKTDMLVFVTARILKDGDSGAEVATAPAAAAGRPFKTKVRDARAQ